MNVKKYLLLLLTTISTVVSIYAYSGNSDHTIVNSQASNSGIKGVCNGDPVAYIIRNHPDLLTHKRDKVLRQGAKASAQYSLQGCINCHASKSVETKLETKLENTYKPVNQSGQFCATCHDQTATTLDCFECHRTTPYEGKNYYKKDHKGLKK